MSVTSKGYLAILSRCKGYSDLAFLVDFRDQLQYSGQLHGYRWMYTKCREHGLRVRKEDVRFVLKELDPKPYGICINGSIDGFLRKIMWLNAYTTNRDPKLIGGYYIEAVRHLRGCPRAVRGDLRTENCFVRDFQHFLVPADRDSTLDRYLEGASTANQRLEYWWGFLRRQCAEFWLSLFADLRDTDSLMVGFWTKASSGFVVSDSSRWVDEFYCFNVFLWACGWVNK